MEINLVLALATQEARFSEIPATLLEGCSETRTNPALETPRWVVLVDLEILVGALVSS